MVSKQSSDIKKKQISRRHLGYMRITNILYHLYSIGGSKLDVIQKWWNTINTIFTIAANVQKMSEYDNLPGGVLQLKGGSSRIKKYVSEKSMDFKFILA